MNIHEHQAKNLLRTYGIPVSEGIVVFSIDEFPDIIKNYRKFII